MTTYFRRSFPILLLLAFTVGCNLVNQIQKKIEEDKKPKVITGTDGKSQITVPGNWSIQKNLNDDATIQVANLRAEQYAIVISESKVDFTSEMTLSDFAEIIKENARNAITNPVMTEIKALSVNGHSAVQFEAEGSMNNIKAKWLYTIIDAPKNYHQIMTWSLQSKFEANRPAFVDLINSFKEIDGLGHTTTTDSTKR